MLKKVYHSEAGKLIRVFILTISFALSGHTQGIFEIIPDTIRSCMADSVFVMANPDYNSISWSNGDTTQSTWLAMGNYSVSGEKNGIVQEKDFYVYILSAKIAENDTSLNCGDTLVLHGTASEFNYIWSPGAIFEDSIHVYPRSTSNFSALISNPDTLWQHCMDTIVISVNQVIQVDTIEQTIIGCPGDSVAQMHVFPSGGFPPYSYIWPPEATALVEDSSYAFGLVDGDKIITISDTIDCILEYPFTVKAHRLPDLELFTKPTDTVYLQNPWVGFYFENPTYDSLLVDTFQVDNQWWDFGDSSDVANSYAPTYAYKTVGPKTIVLTFKTYLGCYGSDTTEIEVLPVKIVACAVITPNDDEWNQYFELFEDNASGNDQNPSFKSSANEPIDLSKYYLSNELVIFNRWGEKVHEVDNYDNDWDGKDLKDGTYFYVIKCHGQYRTDVFKGSFMILGSGGTQ